MGSSDEKLLSGDYARINLPITVHNVGELCKLPDTLPSHRRECDMEDVILTLDGDTMRLSSQS
jgi:hypothetical protein